MTVPDHSDDVTGAVVNAGLVYYDMKEESSSTRHNVVQSIIIRMSTGVISKACADT